MRLRCDEEGEEAVVFLVGSSVGTVDGMVEGEVGRRERIVEGFLDGEVVRYLVGFTDGAHLGERVGDIDGVGNSTDRGR